MYISYPLLLLGWENYSSCRKSKKSELLKQVNYNSWEISLVNCRTFNVEYQIRIIRQTKKNWHQSIVFENQRKSLIQHCDRSELCILFSGKTSLKMQKWSILANFRKTWILMSNSATRQVNFHWTKIGGKCQFEQLWCDILSKIQTMYQSSVN